MPHTLNPGDVVHRLGKKRAELLTALRGLADDLEALPSNKFADLYPRLMPLATEVSKAEKLLRSPT